MSTHQVYTRQEFLNKMSYLLPIGENFINKKQIAVPINEKSTLATLNKLFKNIDINSEECYGYNLWHTSPQKFVSVFTTIYWSDDPLYNTIDLHSLSASALSFPAKQYISLSLINLNSKNNDNGLIYDLNTIQFNSLDQLIELFLYMDSINSPDFTKMIVDILGNVTGDVNARLNKEIKLEENIKYTLEDEKNKLNKEQLERDIEQKLLEAGLAKPTMSTSDIANGLGDLTTKFIEIYIREIKIRRDFSQREHKLLQSWQTRTSEENAFTSFFSERETLAKEMESEINIAHETLSSLNTTLAILNKESRSRDIYDKLKMGYANSSLSRSLENLKFNFNLSPLVLVEDSTPSANNDQVSV